MKEDLDAAYHEHAFQIGRLVLYWAGLEGQDERSIDPESETLVDAFIDALGNSSVPEAVRTVIGSVREVA